MKYTRNYSSLNNIIRTIIMGSDAQDLRFKRIAKETKKGTVIDIGFDDAPNPFIKIDVGIDRKITTNPENYKKLIKIDAQKFSKSLKGEKFDNIIASELIEHLENPSAFLSECQKIIKDYGFLILSTPNPYYIYYALAELTDNRQFFYIDEHINLFPPRIMRKLLAYNGFQLIKRVGNRFLDFQYIYVSIPINKRGYTWLE